MLMLMLAGLVLLGAIALGVGSYLYGVHVGSTWGRKVADEAYTTGRDDAVRFVLYQ